MQTSALAAIVLTALCACRALSKENKSVSAGGAAAVSSVASSAAVGSASTAAVGESPKEPMQWATGQWTRHRLAVGATKSELVYKILKRDGDDYLVEIVAHNAAQPATIMQVALTMKSLRDAKNSQIKSAKVKFGSGAVQEFKGALLGPMQNMYKGLVGLVNIPDIGTLQREDVTVAAGRFPGCFKHANPPSISGPIVKGTSYIHFGVPISAIVKTDTANGNTQMELLEYGLTGAKSEL